MKPATLYAYVSRGLIERHPSADGRTSLYDVADLARLERRSARRGGSPSEIVVASELTLVDGNAGRLFYRGLDPIDASRTRRFEEIAGWLWTGNFDGTGMWRTDPRSRRAAERAALALPKKAAAIDRLFVAASAIEALRRRTSPNDAATDLMSSLVECLPGPSVSSGDRFAVRMWHKLTSQPPSDDLVSVLDAALSLTADHGLTYSALLARIVAASGGDVASSVVGAMAAGVASIRSSYFEDLERAFAVALEHGAARAAANLRPDAARAASSDEPYPFGDPRGRALLEMLDAVAPEQALIARRLIDEIGGKPTAVYAQAALSWTCGMRLGSGEVISLLSRVVGWIAHAFEEQRRPTPFRPRLAYTGPAPRASTPIRMLDAVVGYLSRE